MKDLRRYLGTRVILQLDFEGAGVAGIVEGVSAETVELVDVEVHSGRPGDQPKKADGRFHVVRERIVWVQIP
ncbi:hypothetical protein [Pseudonocardia sp. WMMC193]|uniref:hypothetical protein n=1 Tax=Pseudonocardia sp. WMMC193 TaxID=2911965 RepID=UPI001F217C5B|nr:hypothetical protein [Pseudonocardia sp. WMMC193]MCF7550980.1 hypothetical protein [Pseudonocardia sp. WMMC193]